MIPRQWKPHAVLLLLGVASYAPALTTGFLYDDHLLIETNPSLRSWSLETLKQDFTSGLFHHPGAGVDFYRPLQTLSTRMEYALWELRPFPYHLTNLLFHLGNVLLVFELMLALGVGALAAGLTGALFAVHPIIVEDLLMVSGRGELMGFFFALAGFLFFLRGGRRAVAGTLVCYVLALFSKESAVIMPVLLAALLYSRKELLSRYRILIPMAVITLIYLVLRHHAMGPLPDWRTMYPGRFFLIAFPQALLGYLRILVWPVDLHTDRLLSLPFHSLWPAATLITAGTVLWTGWKGPRGAFLCTLWFILIFLPKSILMMSGSFMSDHWAYPALPAVLFPIAWVLARGWNAPRPLTQGLVRAAAGLFLSAGMALTVHNITTRNTDEKLYRSALRYTSSPTMKYNLAGVLLRQGRPQEALSYLEDLAAADPRNPELIRALAEIHKSSRSVGKTP